MISPTTIRSMVRARSKQGIRVLFEGGARIVFRLFGTGTVRRDAPGLYRARDEDPRQHERSTPQDALADLICAVDDSLAGIEAHTGRTAPSVIT